jgi:multiple sugar transport system ATP-binding protein
MSRLEIENLSKIFVFASGERVSAVQEASLKVSQGELLAVVGPSGSGKTTMLRLIAGLEQPDSGTINIDGLPVNHLRPQDRDVAMVFQHYALYPHMSVYENLTFGLKLRKIPRTEIERRVKEFSQMLALQDCLSREPQALSGGQKQRVALGRALARRPKVLLLDEPLSGLDPGLRGQMRREIVTLQRRLGLTMLYVTHDQTEAMSLGDRIAVIKKGAIQQITTPGDLYRRPCNRFVAEFFGTPPMNFFHGTLVRNGTGLCFRHEQKFIQQKDDMAGSNGNQNSSNKNMADFEGFVMRLPEERSSRMQSHLQKPIIFGIRPEDIKIAELSFTQENEITATTEHVEMLGAETNLHLYMGRTSCVARVPSGNDIALKKPVSLIFDMSRAHFFNSVTEERIDS